MIEDSSERHMRFAQLLPEHNAYVAVMQAAYPAPMERGNSPRQRRRRERLAAFFQDVAKASEVEQAIQTPATYFSAILAGKRGLGDAVAAKIERAYSLPEGWFDAGEEVRQWPFSAELYSTVASLGPDVLHRLENVMRATLGVSPLEKALSDEERLTLFTAIQQPGLLDHEVEERIPATKTPPALTKRKTPQETSPETGGADAVPGKKLAAVSSAKPEPLKFGRSRGGKDAGQIVKPGAGKRNA